MKKLQFVFEGSLLNKFFWKYTSPFYISLIKD